MEYSFGNNQDFLFFYRRNGDGFDSSPTNPLGTDGAFGATGCGGDPFAEVSLDRELFDISNPFGALAADVSGLTASDDVGVYAWTQVGEGQIEGSMPAANQNTTPLLYEAYCQTTDAGRMPNQYCVPTTAVRVASFAVHGRTLTWRSGSETGVLGFEIRRDGRKLAFVRARGAPSGASYRYVDRTARAGSKHTYRLRVVRY